MVICIQLTLPSLTKSIPYDSQSALTPDRNETDHASGNSNVERVCIVAEEARVRRNERREIILKHTGLCRTTRGDRRSVLTRANPGETTYLYIYPDISISDLQIYQQPPSNPLTVGLLRG
jgi:hypothetical protein